MAFLLDREGGAHFDALPFLQYLTAFQACAKVAWCIFATPCCTFAGSKSVACRICYTVHHFCFLSYVSEAHLQYLTAFWDRARAILQYLTAFFAPSKLCNTLQHCGTWGREFAIPYWFQTCLKTSGSDFAIPHSVSAPSVLGGGSFCNTVRNFCFLSCVLEADFQYLTAFWGLPRAILQYRANIAIPYSILGPGVANLQYLTAFQACPKVSGSVFAIPYTVSAPSVLGVSNFCNTVHHFCFLS